MQTTILDSFEHKLPHIISNFSGQYRIIRPSAQSTVEEDPVPIFIRDEPSVLARMARQYLPRNTIITNPVRADMPVVEKTHRLNTEADVLRAATLQLIHPVNVVLSERLPPDARIYCESEVAEGVHSRFDMQWTLVQGGTETKLAILEVKNTKVIHWTEFAPAEATQENAEKMMESVMERQTGTLLAGNAILLSKQAKKYSRACKDVAIFDWNSMFIFGFHGVREHSRERRLVRGIYFDESGPIARKENITFRLMLLGFLVRALRRHQALS